MNNTSGNDRENQKQALRNYWATLSPEDREIRRQKQREGMAKYWQKINTMVGKMKELEARSNN